MPSPMQRAMSTRARSSLLDAPQSQLSRYKASLNSSHSEFVQEAEALAGRPAGALVVFIVSFISGKVPHPANRAGAVRLGSSPFDVEPLSPGLDGGQETVIGEMGVALR